MSVHENHIDPDRDLDRKKKELENQKLEVEIKSISLDRWKFFFAFVPVIGLLVTIVFQLNELRFKEEQHEDNRIDAIEKDYREQYFSHPGDLSHQLSVAEDACENDDLSKDTKLNYCQKIPDLKFRLSEEKSLDSLNNLAQTQSLSAEDMARTQEINELDSLKELKTEELKMLTADSNPTKSNQIKKEISSIDRQIDVIVGQSDVIKSTLVKTDSIDEAKRRIIGITFSENPKNTVLIEEESWFKEGYFRQFGETRISLDQFKSDIATISIKLVDPKTNTKVKEIGDFTLKKGEKESVETDDFIYEIIFQRIGNAGKNPFNKAVYFGYRKYKNT